MSRGESRGRTVRKAVVAVGAAGAVALVPVFALAGTANAAPARGVVQADQSWWNGQGQQGNNGHQDNWGANNQDRNRGNDHVEHRDWNWDQHGRHQDRQRAIPRPPALFPGMFGSS